jgi:hypothetical protein
LPQAVQFSAIHSGCSKRMPVMSRNTPVAAGTSEAPMKGSTMLSLPLPVR